MWYIKEVDAIFEKFQGRPSFELFKELLGSFLTTWDKEIWRPILQHIIDKKRVEGVLDGSIGYVCRCREVNPERCLMCKEQEEILAGLSGYWMTRPFAPAMNIIGYLNRFREKNCVFGDKEKVIILTMLIGTAWSVLNPWD